MIVTLERIPRKVLVAGITNARVGDIESLLAKLRELQLPFQLLRADRIAGLDHVFSAAEHALVAFEQGIQTSHTPDMETLLYAAAEKQISQAIRKIGITQGVSDIILVTITEDETLAQKLLDRATELLGGRQDDGILETWDRPKLESLKSTFQIPEAAVEAARLKGETDAQVVQKLVLERVAVMAARG